MEEKNEKKGQKFGRCNLLMQALTTPRDYLALQQTLEKRICFIHPTVFDFPGFTIFPPHQPTSQHYKFTSMRRTVLRLASAASSSIPAAGPGASAAGAAGTAGGATAQKMVEVELKFQPTAAVLQRAEATALEARPVRWMHDLYFDSEACVLTRADRWLRRRGHGFSGSGRGLGGKQEFELKQPAASSLPQPPHRAAVDHYEELTGAALRQALGLAAVQPPTVNEAVLQAAGLEVFAAIVTRRRTLRCAPPAELLPPRDAGAISLSIDIDDVWFARVRARQTG